MKKLLIIQLDAPYFLFETLKVIEKHQSSLKEFSTTILVTETARKYLEETSLTVVKGITTNAAEVAKESFDVSANLSLAESAWKFHGEVKSDRKLGPYFQDNSLRVNDLWSAYLLTLKSSAPFLTFHLQDVYKNILGFKGFLHSEPRKSIVKTLVFGLSSAEFFPADEQEKFIHHVHEKFPLISIKDIGDVDLVEEMDHVLYLGPQTLEAVRLCEAGALGIFLSRHFTGFNLLPYQEGNYLITTHGRPLSQGKLFGVVENFLQTGKLHVEQDQSLYLIQHEYLYGAYLKCLSSGEPYYPFFQAHVVLWNYLLNLFDVNLDLVPLRENQKSLVEDHRHVLKKLIRLQQYALTSVDAILREAKSADADAATINGHSRNLREIDETSEKVSASHPLLRPILDFYRIRRGQNDEQSLVAQAENSLLIYTEEQQALTAFDELLGTLSDQLSAPIK